MKAVTLGPPTFTEKLSAAETRVAWVARAALGVLMLSGVGLMFANVIARLVFAAPFYWAEEAAVYLNVWCVFIGVALVTKDNAHLRMDLVLRSLPPRWARVLCVLSWAVTVIVCAVVVFGSWMLLRQLAQANLRSVAMSLPMVAVHAAVFVGFLGTLLVALTGCRRYFNVPQSHEDIGDAGELT